MRSFDNAVAIAAAPKTVTDPKLQQLLAASPDSSGGAFFMPERIAPMISFHTAAAIAAAPTTASIDPALRRLLADRVHDWSATGLLGLTHLLVVEAGDTEEALVEAIGFSPLVNPLDGLRFGADGFVTPWDWLEEHDGWLELMMTIGDSGYALFLLVAHADGVASDLRSMCRAHAGR